MSKIDTITQIGIADLQEDVAMLRELLELERKVNQVLMEAVAFYAAEKNWSDVTEDFYCGELSPGVFDSICYEDCEDDLGGRSARAAQKQVEEIRGGK